MDVKVPDEQTAVQRLLHTFVKFRRLQWQQRPMGGVTNSDSLVLVFLHRAGTLTGAGLKVSEISAEMGVAAPTMTQQLQSLEKQGLIEKTPDPADRRAVRVRLTPQGEATIYRLREGFIASLAGLSAYLGEEDSVQLAQLLERVFTYFDTLRDDPAACEDGKIGSDAVREWSERPREDARPGL